MSGPFGTTAGPWEIDGNGDVASSAQIETGGDCVAFQPEIFEESMKFWPANAKVIAQVPALLELVTMALFASDQNASSLREAARAIVAELEKK